MEKRSPEYKIAQRSSQKQRVGDRQACSSLLPWGGGYLNNDSFSQLSIGKIPVDPRLQDLKRMGLHHIWQKVAAEIGVDAFLAMWRILDAEPQFQHYKGGLSLTLRRYRSYIRYQRNQYIKSLASEGLSPEEITLRLKKNLSESLSLHHIKGVIKE